MAEPEKSVMSCEELLKALNDYVDDETIIAVCQEFAAHLADCNPCQVVIDNIRQTIRLYKDGQPFPIPPECSARLSNALRAKWRSHFPDSST
jgi:hypothetical protein